MSPTVKTKESKNIYQKLTDIMSECKGLQKGGTNSFQKYNYVKTEQVDDMLRPLFAKHGVVLRQSILISGENSIPSVVLTELSKGQMANVTYRFTWVNADDPSNSFDDIWFAQGADTGDKGVNKAATAARKYYLMKMFMLGSDVDSDGEADVGGSEQKQQKQSAGRAIDYVKKSASSGDLDF